jgi:hypothetical protein
LRRDPKPSVSKELRRGGPWREALGVTVEPFGAGDRRQDTPGTVQKIPSRVIEIIGVLVVTEQHGIDVADRIGVLQYRAGESRVSRTGARRGDESGFRFDFQTALSCHCERKRSNPFRHIKKEWIASSLRSSQ